MRPLRGQRRRSDPESRICVVIHKALENCIMYMVQGMVYYLGSSLYFICSLVINVPQLWKTLIFFKIQTPFLCDQFFHELGISRHL